MFSRKNNFTLVLIFLICLMFIFSSTVFAQHKFRIATSDKFWAGTGLNVQRLVSAIEYDTGGEIEFEIFPNCSLGSEGEFIEEIQLGTIDMGIIAAGYLNIYTNKLTSFMTPFLFKDSLSQFEFMFESGGEGLSSIMKSNLEEASKDCGFRVLSVLTNGIKDAYFNIPIKNLGDMKGKKIRLLPNQIEMDAWKELGMIPTTLPWGEVYSALRNKVFDACELTESDFLLYKFSEVSPYYVGTDHLNLNNVIVISEKAWNSLSPKLQNIVKEDTEKVSKLESCLALGFDQTLIIDIKKYAKEMVVLDEEEKIKIRQDILPGLLDKYGEDIGKNTLLTLAKSDIIVKQWCVDQGWNVE